MDADRVRLVFWTSIIVIGGLGFWLYASSPADDGGRARWRQWAAWGVPLAAALFRQFFHFRWYGVKTSEDAANDMSTPAQRTATDGDGRTDGRPVSAPNPWMERLQVDRTRAAVIELMVYSGWRVEQIRTVVKGENAALGAEIDAARQRLGMPEAPRIIAVSERGAPQRPLVLDRELEYKPPV